jgi:hypothetical protein
MPNKSVAEITAETMHNYLLMGHILQCHVSRRPHVVIMMRLKSLDDPEELMLMQRRRFVGRPRR